LSDANETTAYDSINLPNYHHEADNANDLIFWPMLFWRWVIYELAVILTDKVF